MQQIPNDRQISKGRNGNTSVEYYVSPNGANRPTEKRCDVKYALMEKKQTMDNYVTFQQWEF